MMNLFRQEIKWLIHMTEAQEFKAREAFLETKHPLSELEAENMKSLAIKLKQILASEAKRIEFK